MSVAEVARWSSTALLATLSLAWGIHPNAVGSARDAAGARGDAPALRGEWPDIAGGVWELASTRVLPSGKTQRWSDRVRSCAGDGAGASELFRGYWGLGALMEAGCRYDSVRTAAGEFKIASECMVRRAGKVRSEAIVSVKDKESFEMKVDVPEGKLRYRGTQTGRRVAGCDDGAGGAGAAGAQGGAR